MCNLFGNFFSGASGKKFESRNPKPETISNDQKCEILNLRCLSEKLISIPVFVTAFMAFEHSNFGLVSYFGIRISDFRRNKNFRFD